MSSEAVQAVLQRAAENITFYSQIAEDCTKALKDYDLTWEERAALASGDMRRLESHIGGKLDEQMMTKVLTPLLSREKW